VPNDTGEWTGEPEAAVATTDPNGMFQFLTIPSGSYTLQTIRTPQQREDGATGSITDEPLMFATMPVVGRHRRHRRPASDTAGGIQVQRPV
jgi:hypothetical protein